MSRRAHLGMETLRFAQLTLSYGRVAARALELGEPVQHQGLDPEGDPTRTHFANEALAQGEQRAGVRRLSASGLPRRVLPGGS